jgi:hypothetical protein
MEVIDMADMKEERIMVINYASYSVLKGVVEGAFPKGGFTLPDWEQLPTNAPSTDPIVEGGDSEEAKVSEQNREDEVGGQTGELKGLQCPECEETIGLSEITPDTILCLVCGTQDDIGKFMGLSQRARLGGLL